MHLCLDPKYLSGNAYANFSGHSDTATNFSPSCSASPVSITRIMFKKTLLTFAKVCC